MSHRYPALDFPLYGLDASWPGRRWLEFVEGHVGRPLWAAWLAHRDDAATEPWTLVASLPEPRHGTVMSRPGADPTREVAFTAAFGLANYTSPSELLTQADRRLYLRSVVAHCEREADRWHDWPVLDWTVLDWTVDARTVPARVLEWAGAWAGFVVLPDVAVVVVSAALAPAGVSLVQVDSPAYGFDASVALDYPGVLERSRERAGGTVPEAGRWPLHADHRRLLEPIKDTARSAGAAAGSGQSAGARSPTS